MISWLSRPRGKGLKNSLIHFGPFSKQNWSLTFILRKFLFALVIRVSTFWDMFLYHIIGWCVPKRENESFASSKLAYRNIEVAPLTKKLSRSHSSRTWAFYHMQTPTNWAKTYKTSIGFGFTNKTNPRKAIFCIENRHRKSFCEDNLDGFATMPDTGLGLIFSCNFILSKKWVRLKLKRINTKPPFGGFCIATSIILFIP